MKSTIPFLIFFLAFHFISCGSRHPGKECLTFEEMKDPTSDTLSDWSHVSKGLHASFISTDDRMPKSVAPGVSVNKSVALTGWRGEKISAQLLLWSAEEVDPVELEFADFESVDHTLPASVAQARFVRYVMTDEFGPGCGHRKPEDFPASLSADMLDNLPCFHMEAKTVRPVWLTFSIPSAAVAGNYKGTLTLHAGGRPVEEFGIELTVVDRVLPEPSEWLYHLDLWQHPSAVARVHNLEVWSDAHFEKMKPLMKMLADAGQKVITTSIIYRPWNGQTEDAFPSMVNWIRKLDGTWEYSFEVFDRWVEFMMGCGITEQINCYSMIPWRLTFPYFDSAENMIKELHTEPGDPAYADFWGNFLTAFARHLKEKGWFDRTTIAMDERPMKVMQEAIAVIRKADPDFKISLAGSYYPEIEQEIFDYCSGWRHPFPDDVIARRKTEGKFTTYYTCCSEPTPNTFTFSPLEEASYIGRAIAARKADGYLRWAFNSWPLEPLLDSRFRSWASGDTYLVYPGNRTSLRFEHLIDGIQAFEKQRLSGEL